MRERPQLTVRARCCSTESGGGCWSIGGNAYRVSLSWLRIYPIANGEINEAGLQFACEIERLGLPLLPSFSMLIAQIASG